MLYIAFITGLLGSLHCLGMCAPIALSLPFGKGLKGHLRHALYQIGRLSTYIFLGAVIGMVGQALYLVGFQYYISMTAGIILVLLGLLAVNLDTWLYKIPFFSMQMRRISAVLGKLLTNKNTASMFVVGLLNGLLPCGLVYTALLGAVAAGDGPSGALFMGIFGLGTLPVMAAAGAARSFFKPQFKFWVRRLYPYWFVVMGLMLIWRGYSVKDSQLPDCHTQIEIQHQPQTQNLKIAFFCVKYL
ncbi:MAG: sulfite exporter TauE/SafE family protein [Bernardetiaceae bacterium]|nr:sulfite exporter TauE/SafE family protein [Bernardetiaceae bacterium]